MKQIQRIKWQAFVLACVGVVAPQIALAADAPSIQDIKLASGGTLVGQVMSEQGNAISESPIMLQQQGQKAIQTMTRAN